MGDDGKYERVYTILSEARIADDGWRTAAQVTAQCADEGPAISRERVVTILDRLLTEGRIEHSDELRERAFRVKRDGDGDGYARRRGGGGFDLTA